ncbi:Magnesium transporter NIPA [Penicillium lagena]|uniref:Magnesium transporter NIPA n=1 Tax=Penicillium lagena TaxID=94218 RepID=UPI002540F997|nr:Magnesium transporter NIPA [Penicillium lagena]KAJ5612113.1 Magnesium transporter NIPA [Penicillium lagena]
MGNLGDLSPQGSVAIGVLVGLVSTSLQAIGLTLQRKSHILEDEKHPYDVRRPPYKRRRWQLGMAMFVISNIVGSTIQITTLPLPVLSTLQASGLVFNTIFATVILGEPFTRYSLAGTVLVCIGAVLIGTFGAIGEPAHSLDQLLELLQRRPFLLWMGGTAVIVAVILASSKLLTYCLPSSRTRPAASGYLAPHLQRLQARIKLIRGMCYGSVSGILSAHTLLLAKSAVELLVRTVVDRVNQFNRWQSWVILLAMIFLALTQLFYLHRGLKLCSTSVLYPFVFCIYNIIAILDGLIYFRQASQLAGYHAGLIALGTVILLGGVLCLSWRLEDIDNHAAVTVVGPTQTGLGPGMAVVEEHSPTRTGLLDGRDDEEAQIGEREPLLHSTVRSRRLSSYHRARAPSLPVVPHVVDQRDSADLDPASIWAELDDSDYDYDARMRWSTDRPRSTSSSAALTGPARGLARHSTVGPATHGHLWATRRVPPYAYDSRWRRPSAPPSGAALAPRKQRVLGSLSPSTGTEEVAGYGTIQEDDDSDDARRRPDDSQDAGAGLLANSRRALAGAWRHGRQFWTQWTRPSHADDERSVSPRSEIRLPSTRPVNEQSVPVSQGVNDLAKPSSSPP